MTPLNGEAALGDAATPKLTGLPQSNSSFAFRQACRHGTIVVEVMPPGHLIALAQQRPNALALALKKRSREQILRDIGRLRVCQPYGRIFWGLEQRIARLSDELERMGS